MNGLTDLPGVIAKLTAIEQAGQLADLEHEIEEALGRGPRDPFERYPHARWTVERHARIASRILGLPHQQCRDAAIEVVLPTTRLRVALAVIDDYHARLQNEPVRDFSRAMLARRGA